MKIKTRKKISVVSNFQDKVWSASLCFLFKFLKHMFYTFSVSKPKNSRHARLYIPTSREQRNIAMCYFLFMMMKRIANVVLMQSYLVSCEQVSINPLLQSGDLRLLRSQQVSTSQGGTLKVSKSKKEKGNISFSSSMRF